METLLSWGGGSVLWVAPGRIEFKISPVADLVGRKGGDWDIDRRWPLLASAKHRAIVQRYVDGADWRETDLFRDLYARRFAEGGQIRGEANMDALLRQYETRVDAMFADMKANGFRVSDGRGRHYPLPTLLIGRDGDVFLGNQGNHRVAMARVLGLKQIAGRIVCRHRQA